MSEYRGTVIIPFFESLLRIDFGSVLGLALECPHLRCQFEPDRSMPSNLHSPVAQ
jgi:hypothetical protein